MILNAPKAINHSQLDSELQAAGINLPIVVGYDQFSKLATVILQLDGTDIPVGLQPQVRNVITAHVALLSPLEVAEKDMDSTYVAALARLDSIIANGGTYTQIQARDALVDIAKMLRQLARIYKA